MTFWNLWQQPISIQEFLNNRNPSKSHLANKPQKYQTIQSVDPKPNLHRWNLTVRQLALEIKVHPTYKLYNRGHPVLKIIELKCKMPIIITINSMSITDKEVTSALIQIKIRQSGLWQGKRNPTLWCKMLDRMSKTTRFSSCQLKLTSLKLKQHFQTSRLENRQNKPDQAI